MPFVSASTNDLVKDVSWKNGKKDIRKKFKYVENSTVEIVSTKENRIHNQEVKKFI